MKEAFKTVLVAVIFVFSIILMVQTANAASFSASEVAKHSSPNDCWVVIDGKVYDFTKFMEKHAAGADTIATSCGKDGTEPFNQCHPPEAKNAIKEFHVGDFKN